MEIVAFSDTLFDIVPKPMEKDSDSEHSEK